MDAHVELSSGGTKPSNALASSILASTRWTAVSYIFTEVVAAGATLVLARLVGPTSFGLVALAGIAIAGFQLIIGFGFGSALIQRHNTDDNILSSVFWLNLFSSCVCAFIVSLLSLQYARWLRQPALTPIIICLSATLPLGGLSVVQEALLTKSLAFRTLAFRSAVSAVAGGSLGIALAFLGAGAWALVVQQFTRDICRTTLLWRTSQWRPKRTFELSAIRHVSCFAGKSFIGDLGTFVQNNFDGMIIGRYIGSTSLGLYRLADRLVELCLRLFPRALQAVSLAHFSRVQNELPELRRLFMFGLSLNCLVALPCMALLAGASDLVLLLFGPQWAPAADVLRIMCIIGGTKAVLLFAAPVLQALSRPGLVSLITLAGALGNVAVVLICVNIFTGSNGEPSIVAIAASRSLLLSVVLLPVLVVNALSLMRLRISDAVSAILPSLLASVIIYAIARSLSSKAIWDVPVPVSVAAMGLLSAVALAGVARALRPELCDIVLNDLFAFRRKSQPRSRRKTVETIAPPIVRVVPAEVTLAKPEAPLLTPDRIPTNQTAIE